MSNLHLTRYSYAPYGTYGVLRVGNLTLQTVEQPWRLNQRMISCIPTGTYKLKPHSSQKFPRVWALVNHDIGVYHQPTTLAPPDARIAILIHVGNTADDVSGCIAVGTSLGWVNNKLAVTNSRTAVDMLRKLDQSQPFQSITITDVDKTQPVDYLK